jgi:hypothetical protein
MRRWSGLIGIGGRNGGLLPGSLVFGKFGLKLPITPLPGNFVLQVDSRESSMSDSP